MFCKWLITLRRFDIHYATNTLSRFRIAPHEGHFKAIQRVFSYLKKSPSKKILIDPGLYSLPTHEKQDYDWSEFYPDTEEEIPPDRPNSKGNLVHITCYVDTDHAHDQVTRRLVIGILLFVNNILIYWISKRQKTVETLIY